MISYYFKEFGMGLSSKRVVVLAAILHLLQQRQYFFVIEIADNNCLCFHTCFGIHYHLLRARLSPYNLSTPISFSLPHSGWLVFVIAYTSVLAAWQRREN